jgi:hypothetical protein
MLVLGVVLGVGIWFVGALFWAVLYRTLSAGLIEKLNESRTEK